MRTRVQGLRLACTLQLSGHVRLGIARIVQQDDVSRSCANRNVIQISLRTMKAVVPRNCFAPARDAHAVGCRLLRDYFELVRPADRSADLDHSTTGTSTIQIIAIDITLRHRQRLPGFLRNRIKPDSAPTRILQYDAYIGRTVVVRSEDDVECPQ